MKHKDSQSRSGSDADNDAKNNPEYKSNSGNSASNDGTNHNGTDSDGTDSDDKERLTGVLNDIKSSAHDKDGDSALKDTNKQKQAPIATPHLKRGDMGAVKDPNKKVSIGHLMEALETQGFGALLFAPAFIAVMPTGGVPGVPTVCGIIVALISVQLVFGKKRPWFPSFIDNISFAESKLDKGIKIARPVTTMIDSVTKPRLSWLITGTAKKGVALVCMLAGLAMPPLEVVPFAAIIPASSIMLCAIGLITKDGYVVLAALILNIFTMYFIVTQVL